MTMAKRNCDIRASRNHIKALIAIVLLALVFSFNFGEARAADRPNFNDHEAFQLKPEDRKLYNAEFAWCLKTPTDGAQCYVLGSDMAGWLGRGDNDDLQNLITYGEVGRGLIPVAQLPEKERTEAYDMYKAVWGN